MACPNQKRALCSIAKARLRETGFVIRYGDTVRSSALSAGAEITAVLLDLFGHFDEELLIGLSLIETTNKLLH